MDATRDTLESAIANGNLREFDFTNVECKRNWKQDSGKSISALANRSPDRQAFLVVGVEDTGTLAGHPESWLKSTEEAVSQHLNQYLDPVQTCEAIECLRSIEGSYIVILIRNPGAVVKWDMKAYKGAGTTIATMSPQEEMEMTFSLPGTTDYTNKPWSGDFDVALARSFLETLIKNRSDVPFSSKDLQRGIIVDPNVKTAIRPSYGVAIRPPS